MNTFGAQAREFGSALRRFQRVAVLLWSCWVRCLSSEPGGLFLAFAAEIFAAVGEERFGVFAGFVDVRFLRCILGIDFLAVFLLADFEFIAFLREVELTLAGGFALLGDLQACLLAKVRKFEALGVAAFFGELFFAFTVFVGEDAVEILEQGGAGLGCGR